MGSPLEGYIEIERAHERSCDGVQKSISGENGVYYY